MHTDELLGRADLLDVLAQVTVTQAGRGDSILLVGEAGIGKTAGLLAARAMARTAGYQVLETVGSEAETNLPFAGLHRLLRPLLATADKLLDVQRQALFTALGLCTGPRADPFVVSVATLNLISPAAEEPALMVSVDDIHWLDDETAQVLAFAARRLRDERVVLVAASSRPQDRPSLREAFRELNLGRLDEASAHRLLARIAVTLTRQQRDWVVGQAIGNPLALIELAKTAPSLDRSQTNPIRPALTLTPVLERAFAGGWSQLPKLSKDAVLVAALDGDASMQEIMAAAAQLNHRETMASALEPAQSMGLLSFDETSVHFRHPLIATAIAHMESVGRRQAAHRALGAVITVNSSRRAWHRALGAPGPDEAIASELESTAAGSIRRGETAAAVLAFERAAQLSADPVERGRRLLVAARQAARLGQPGLVDRLLAGAASGELSVFDRIRAEMLHENFGGVVITDSSRVTQLCRLADEAVAAGETELAIELADAAVRRRCAAPVDELALAQLVAVAQRLARGPAEARTVAVLALADPIGHGRAVLAMLRCIDESSDASADELSAYGVAGRAVGEYSAALKLFNRAEVTLRARGQLGPLARNFCVQADLRLELGDWDRAATALVEFGPLAAASMSVSHRATALLITAKLAALRGDTPAALALVSEAEHAPTARSGSRYLARAQIVRGIVYISADKHRDAYAALSRVLDADEPSHHFREQFDAVAYFAEAAAHIGQQDQARDLLGRLERVADVSGAPVLLMHLTYARAVLAADECAEELYLTALASAAASSPWHRARIQLAYGRWLRRQQRVTQSREPLQAALTTLQQLGAASWAKEALDELDAAGATSNRRDDGLNLLSVQESKIARLAAKGLSNREIGEQLNLSPRTVSSHLYRIFPKLGVSGRGQLAARLEAERIGAGSA